MTKYSKSYIDSVSLDLLEEYGVHVASKPHDIYWTLFESFVAVRSVVMVVVRIVAIETRGKHDEMGIFACFRVYFRELEQQQTFFRRPDSKLYRTFATENRRELL